MFAFYEEPDESITHIILKASVMITYIILKASLTSYAPNAARPPKVTPARRDGTDLSNDQGLYQELERTVHLPFLDKAHDASCGDQCSEGISSHVMLFHITHCSLSEMHQIPWTPNSCLHVCISNN